MSTDQQLQQALDDIYFVFGKNGVPFYGLRVASRHGAVTAPEMQAILQELVRDNITVKYAIETPSRFSPTVEANTVSDVGQSATAKLQAYNRKRVLYYLTSVRTGLSAENALEAMTREGLIASIPAEAPPAPVQEPVTCVSNDAERVQAIMDFVNARVVLASATTRENYEIVKTSTIKLVNEVKKLKRAFGIDLDETDENTKRY